MLHVVWNAHAGKGQAAQLLAECVVPRLEEWRALHDGPDILLHESEKEGGAVRLGEAIAKQNNKAACVCIIVGGDGTVHEFLQGALSSNISVPIMLVIVPAGTSNALYHAYFGPESTPEPQWRLRSFEAFTQNKHKPLSLMHVEPGKETACVVVSHALHAAILRDSEKLRTSHPGLDRFKMAAKQNATVWAQAKLTILPKEGQPVFMYDAAKRTFRKVDGNSDGRLTLDGPFLYMNAMTVDRLEPEFVPAPFAMQTTSDQMDLIVIRPCRQPASSDPDSFAQHVLWPVILDGMYKHGRHVSMTYASDGTIEHGNGQVIVEYFRAHGYIWEPLDAHARTMCVDGTITNVTEPIHVTALDDVQIDLCA